MTDKPEFALADKAITFAAAKIEQAMVELLQTTLPLSHVVPTDYVVKRLVYGLLERNPASLDWLNRHGGDHSMRLANVLMDWRDTWGESP
jgi:hypothetical protein